MPRKSPLCSFKVAAIGEDAAIDVDAFVGRRGIGNDGVIGEGDKAGHPRLALTTRPLGTPGWKSALLTLRAGC